MRQVTFRLKAGDLLKEEIEKRAKEMSIQAGVLLSIVAGVENAVLRMPKLESGEHAVHDFPGPWEVVSGTGTISKEGCHIHLSVSDKDGNMKGGHLKDGCKVRITAEIVISIFDDVTYSRTYDETTGFKELDIK